MLDAAYSLAAIRRRRSEHTILCRDLGGYFAHVWSVNPLVGADPLDPSTSAGGPETTELAPRHTVIEGHAGYSLRLARVPAVNFLLGQLALLPVLLRLVRSGRVTALRVGDPYYLGLLGLLLGRLGRVPVVLRINGNYDAIFARTGRPAFPRLFRSRRLEKRVERFVLRRVSFVTAANRDNLEFAVANGADERRTAIFPYGNLVDPLHFAEPTSRDAPPDGLPSCPFAIAVSRLEPLKRVEDVLRAFVSAQRSQPELHLVLVGSGSLRVELEDLADELGVSDQVHLVGDRDQAWLAGALARAAVVVAASAGRVLVEAALSATPIVAYDDDWHGELVRNGETGYLVPVGDIEALAAGVCAALEDVPTARRLGDAARAETLVRMDPERLDAAERDVYVRLRR